MIQIQEAYSLYSEEIVNINDFRRFDEIYKGGFKCSTPGCNATLVARKGTIKAHHFASKEKHADDCRYNYLIGLTNNGEEIQYKIDLSKFYENSDPTTDIIAGPGRPQGSTNKNASLRVSNIQQLVEINQMIENGTLDRNNIKGLSRRKWDNFYIKDLNLRLVNKIKEYNDRNSQTPYVFQGELKNIWNYSGKGYLVLKGKRIGSKVYNVRLCVLNNTFKDETINDYKEEKIEQSTFAFLGIPKIVSHDEDFVSVVIEVDSNDVEEVIYELI